MKMTRKIAVFGLFIVTALLARGASAAVPAAQLGRNNVFDSGSYSAIADCWPCDIVSEPFFAYGQASGQNQGLATGLGFASAEVWESIVSPSWSIQSDSTRWSAGSACPDVTWVHLQGVDFLLADATGSGETSAFLSFLGNVEIPSREPAIVPWESEASKIFAHIGAVTSGVSVAWDGWGVGL